MARAAKAKDTHYRSSSRYVLYDGYLRDTLDCQYEQESRRMAWKATA